MGLPWEGSLLVAQCDTDVEQGLDKDKKTRARFLNCPCGFFSS